jgi:hypothetical protein
MDLEHIMSDYQDWVLTCENLYELEIIDLVMDHPSAWYCDPGYYPNLLGCPEE